VDPITALILGGGALIGGIAGGVGSANAASAQEASAREALGLQRQMWQQGREDMAPWLQAGRTSLADLLKMVQGGYDASAMAQDPGFQFRMAEGQRALERSAAARGGLNSGATLRSLTRYSQGVASDEFANRFNRLAGIAGMGQGAAQNLGAAGGQYANSAGSLYGAMGNARAAGSMGMANAISGGAQNLATLGGLYSMGGGGIPTQQRVGSMVAGGGSGYGWGPNTYGG
jgi:hypothetical protein